MVCEEKYLVLVAVGSISRTWFCDFATRNSTFHFNSTLLAITCIRLLSKLKNAHLCREKIEYIGTSCLAAAYYVIHAETFHSTKYI